MNADHHDHFDPDLRARHQASLERLSPRVQAHLVQRRNAALRGMPVRRTHAFRYAAGFAVLCALALGLRFTGMPAPHDPATALSVASAPAPVATMLDEDPEFYAWLASSDAQLVALE